MTCDQQISGWASGILESLGETGISIGSASTWLKTHLGPLNIALRTNFVIDASGCISGDMNQADSGVYTQMYHCYYYRRKANDNLGAAAYDWSSIHGEDQGTIRRVSKNEIAKTYLSMAKDCKNQLQDLIAWYHSEFNPNTPYQVLYNNRTDVTKTGLQCPCPPSSLYSPTNYVWTVLD